ncbi:RNA methyltransferase [Dissulfurirhabdus thermomarina]|uniref:RNA methyltransferase n=1 Tax=Dissulfurirhabdus thermomarina TaxID=1765737 RepID=A0A6N9TNT8_DISTH|nr:RNA methyltransferase [Dissulfurirhabdus thermomarina]NDY42819.1 RNA methyltransferase [Dissulfurirhabdus thermomarina]NMX22548.1 RNA methyltransferase [Dissulfurirhabdus thermomarina]
MRLDNVTVVLHEPRYPENIGAAARACRNMGARGLVAVRPRNPDREKMLKMATHEAADLVEAMPILDSLDEALAPFQHVVGTTARTGRHRRPTDTPRGLARGLAPVLARNRVALLFGSEKWGLSNAALARCQSLVTIPTAGFSSVNLAQSVMILLYELRLADGDAAPPLPRLADQRELEGLFAHLAELFEAVGFIHPESPEHWMANVRRFVGRLQLQAREVRLARGFCRQVLWALGRSGEGRREAAGGR